MWYEATQRQRALEATMRAQRQEMKLLQEGGADEDDLINLRARYRATSQEYARFSEAAGLPQQRERVSVDGLGNIMQGKYTGGSGKESPVKLPPVGAKRGTPVQDAERSELLEHPRMVLTSGAPSAKLSKASSPGDPSSMERVPPTPHTKEELDELVRYAADRGLNLVDPKSFDGDIELAKSQFDAISAIKQEYKIQKKLSIKFTEMHDGDLGETMPGGKTIYLNYYAYRDRGVTNAYLNADKYLSSTDTLGIGAHEMGHVISAYYGEKGLDIAKKTYYNIYKRDISYEELLDFLKENVSGYSAFISPQYTDRPFDTRFYKEVVPEMLAKSKTNPDEFTEEFVRVLKEVCKL